MTATVRIFYTNPVFQVKCLRRGVAALLHQYINQVIEVIRQIIGEFMFQAV